MMMSRGSLLVPVVLVALQPVAVHAQTPPVRAEPNDNRMPAGRMVEGELRVELEAVEAAWYPRGPDLPPVMTPVLAEVGRAPQVPGPLIRTAAGTPVHVTIRNSLDRPIVVRGLTDRPAIPATSRPQGLAFLPTFAFADPLVVRPGETGEARFTPTAEVSSFYYVRTLPPEPDARAVAASVVPGLGEGAFMGGLVIDAPGAAQPADERVLMITRWNTPGQGFTWKMMVNGLSWPFTERLEYTVGDTARWRIINASNIEHPMHLHGFYFTVDALGDTHTDTSYADAVRPLVVTQVMQTFSSMRLSWVPERPGNWLFHCHLVRHMGEAQHFAAERAAAASREPETDAAHHMDLMAGLITGITVRPSADGEPPDEAPARRIDLWTGARPGIYDGAPELGFVVQHGPQPPAPDSTRVPGSPLILTRGEPTEIVVHNRLDFPLSVHWHGLELRSLFDGVGGWSGYPGSTRPPIAPGDSARVLINPVRAGSFMYHTHGEPGHELSQGLYGPFLVLERGETRDTDTDRVFTLASRGASPDAAPAINGRTRPGPERFAPGRSYRLRFLHISADEFKRVRLLKDGEPVSWRPLARDGADLPPPLQVPGPATLGIGVGETYDVAWAPDDSGVYVLEVTTEFFPALGGTVVQRLAFGVGDVPDSALSRAQRAPAIARMPPAEAARYAGTFVGYPVVVSAAHHRNWCSVYGRSRIAFSRAASCPSNGTTTERPSSSQSSATIRSPRHATSMTSRTCSACGTISTETGRVWTESSSRSTGRSWSSWSASLRCRWPRRACTVSSASTARRARRTPSPRGCRMARCTCSGRTALSGCCRSRRRASGWRAHPTCGSISRSSMAALPRSHSSRPQALGRVWRDGTDPGVRGAHRSSSTRSNTCRTARLLFATATVRCPSGSSHASPDGSRGQASGGPPQERSRQHADIVGGMNRGEREQSTGRARPRARTSPPTRPSGSSHPRSQAGLAGRCRPGSDARCGGNRRAASPQPSGWARQPTNLGNATWLGLSRPPLKRR
jgi:manganese oxidase